MSPEISIARPAIFASLSWRSPEKQAAATLRIPTTDSLTISFAHPKHLCTETLA
jgi:hypothetical protein